MGFSGFLPCGIPFRFCSREPVSIRLGKVDRPGKISSHLHPVLKPYQACCIILHGKFFSVIIISRKERLISRHGRQGFPGSHHICPPPCAMYFADTLVKQVSQHIQRAVQIVHARIVERAAAIIFRGWNLPQVGTPLLLIFSNFRIINLSQLLAVHYLFISWTAPILEFWRVISSFPAFFASASISCASRSVSASGFSHSTLAPLRSASIVKYLCVLLAVHAPNQAFPYPAFPWDPYRCFLIP